MNPLDNVFGGASPDESFANLASPKLLPLDFMVVPELLATVAYVPNAVRIRIIDPEAIFLTGLLGESGRKLVSAGVEFYFTKTLAEKLIGKGIALEVNTPPDLTKGGDVQMKRTQGSEMDNPLTSPEMPAQSRGETLDQHCGQPEGTFKQFMKDSNEPTELQQAIERIKRELVMTLLEDICQFKQDIKTVVEAAEQSRELREELNEVQRLRRMDIADSSTMNMVEELQDQLRIKDAMVERLVEALIPFAPGTHPISWGKIKAALGVEMAKHLTGFNYKAEQALSDAAKLGFPKQKEKE